MNSKITYKSKKIKDLIVIQPKVFTDFRGKNFEGFNCGVYNELLNQVDSLKNIGLKFTIDSFSVSKKNVLRGFHGDKENWKLIDILYGDIYFVVIDTRVESETYKNVEYFGLNDENKHQVLVPPGCVNAHYVLSEKCIFHYKLSDNYVAPENQIHIKWNDPDFKIIWPCDNPILSERDKI